MLSSEYDGQKQRKTKQVKVGRTARIEASDRTAEALEKARRLIGAPKFARFRVEPYQWGGGSELVIESFTVPRPVGVEFYWEEWVNDYDG